MTIKNFDQLATTPIRKDALSIVEAGYQAIQTDLVIQKGIAIEGEILKIGLKQYDLSLFNNVYVIAFGKSSYLASLALESILGKRITAGYATGITEGGALEKIKYVQGTHPRPSEKNHAQALNIIDLVENAQEDDLILAVISGGGSALFPAPFQIDIETQADVSDALMNGGADIHELNIVRKHLSRVKGGRLAELAFPAKLVAIVFSDVPGNDLKTIASGATVMDQSTNDEAQEIIDRYQVLEKVNLEALELSETPKDAEIFSNVDNILLLEPTSAVEAMELKARDLGYPVRILSTELEGNAHEVGAQLLVETKGHEVVLAAGETTVEVLGDGEGGRNQELVLANLEKIRDGQVIISAASDGADHSEAAGAIADSTSITRAKEASLDPAEYLRKNDSFHFFQQSGEYLDTGALDSNVSDMYLVLESKD